MQNDLWCPNCARLVKPQQHREIAGFLWTLGGLIIIPTMLPYFGLTDWVATWWLMPLLWVVVVLAAIGALPVTRSCPICRSRNLGKQAPAA